MMTNKNRFDSEQQYEIARHSIDKAYEVKYGIMGNEDMAFEEYDNFIDMILFNSDESAFHGTDEEISKIWYNTKIFE